MDFDLDTPKRKQKIGTVISNFEESPVFSYLNSLSPIKPVKSTHNFQTINSLCFASPQSMFMSPYIVSQKQPRLLERHGFSELSEPTESSSKNGDEGNPIAGVLDTIKRYTCLNDPHEIFDPRNSTQQITNHPPSDSLEHAIDLPRSNLIGGDINVEPVPVVDCSSGSLAQLAGDNSVESQHSLDTEMELAGLCQLDQTKERGCEWERNSNDASDLLTFDSSTSMDLPKEPQQSLSSKLAEDINYGSQKKKPINMAGHTEQREVEKLSNQTTETVEQKELDCKGYPNSGVSRSGPEVNDLGVDEIAKDGKTFVYEGNTQQQRGMLRRCLIFEMEGANEKKAEADLSITSSISQKCDATITSDDKELVSFKTVGPSLSVLPGIGIHLNALAATTMNRKVVIGEAVASGKQLICIPSTSVSGLYLSSKEKPIHENLVETKSSEPETCDAGNGAVMVQDTSQSAFGVRDEFIQNKQRHGLEDDGHHEGCKRCSCKKSKCLKLYCECFAAGIYCIEPCSCQECFNKPIHEDIVLATRKHIESRNPLAFAPKVIRNSESADRIREETGKLLTSARHIRGCNCKKSSCLKKYCECFQGSVGCSISCRCQGCQNTFGRNYGVEEGETESCEEKMVDENSLNNEMQNEEVKDSDLIPPITPSLQNPSLKLQPSSVPSTSSSAYPSSSQMIKSRFPCPVPFKLNIHNSHEDETHEVQLDNSLRSSGVKNASPNSKRVQPPHNEQQRIQKRRKLVLQSIPSTLSLTSQYGNNEFMVKLK